MAARELISVVFSFRNEAEVLPELLRRLESVFEDIDADCEFVFVDDASTDGSGDILRGFMDDGAPVRVVTMSNRFGVNPCIVAGMRHARGDVVITMDTDLQDPPEVIPQMIAKWRGGADVVHGTRTARDGESWTKMLVTRTAYRLLRLASGVDLPVDTGMFKLMSRRAVDAVCAIDEQDPFLRGLITWVGYQQETVHYRREARQAGETHFPLLSAGPAHEFILGLVSLSTRPLIFTVVLGLAIIALAALGVAIGAIYSLAVTVLPWGFWALALLTALCGIQTTGTGIVGLYLARVYLQVRGRPSYIIADEAQATVARSKQDSAA